MKTFTNFNRLAKWTILDVKYLQNQTVRVYVLWAAAISLLSVDAKCLVSDGKYYTHV